MDIELAKQASSLPDLSSWFVSIGRLIIDFIPTLFSLAKSIVGVLIGISFPLALFFLIGIIYCVEGLKRIRNKEEAIFDTKVETAFETSRGDESLSKRWRSALSHINSENPNDWKQAIIEADIILDDLLTKMGYRGDSVGEKLKRVVRGDMNSLNEAWEAHKVRNRIAHEGSNFSINHLEAKDVISMYKKVFEEFYYI